MIPPIPQSDLVRMVFPTDGATGSQPNSMRSDCEETNHTSKTSKSKSQ